MPADFAAHPTASGLAVDRMSDGRSARVMRTASAPQASSPAEVVQVDHRDVAALWTGDGDRVVVRRTVDPASPQLGEVTATWRDGILRLSLRTSDGTALSTSRFRRVDSVAAPQALERALSDPWAMRSFPGIYRADLRDERDTHVGWLRVRILPYQGLPRDYAGDLPPSLDGSLAAGAVALLDAEIDAIVEGNAYPSDHLPGGLVP